MAVITKARRKPVLVDAIQWDGANTADIQNFLQKQIWWLGLNDVLQIDTLEKRISVSSGDWIVKDPKGELTTCTPAEWEENYY